MVQPRGNRRGLVIAVPLILSLTVGLGVGLLIGWVIAPVKYVDTTIADLAPEAKEEVILLAASAYVCDRDLEKAQARLALLDAPNINQWVADLVDRYVSAGRDEADIRALVALATGLGVNSPSMVAYAASPTPLPTHTPLPSPTSTPTLPPTATPIPPTDTPTEVPPTATPSPTSPPTAAPQPTATSVPPTAAPQPTATSVPPTQTPASPTATSKPKPTNTPKPPPTNTPKPKPAAPKWSNSARLVGPGEDGQRCDGGNLQLHVTVVDANGNQIPGIWIYDKYSGQYQVTGNVGSPDWGPGETKFEYGIGGGGSLCVASGEGGGCVSDFTRDMPCYWLPPFEDLWNSGYCLCEKPDITYEECQQLFNEGKLLSPGAGHFSWRVVFKRSS
jgi:hypothetical protein